MKDREKIEKQAWMLPLTEKWIKDWIMAVSLVGGSQRVVDDYKGIAMGESIVKP